MRIAAALQEFVRQRARYRCEYCLIPQEQHFVWEQEHLIGLTPLARATIASLRLNHPQRLAIRRSLLLEGIRFG